MIVRAAHPDHFAWLARRTRLSIGPGFQALEAVDGNRILGMVGYDGWTTTAVSMHVAIDDPYAFSRMLKPAFGLAFYEYGKEVVLGQVLSTNARSLEMCKRLGFREVYRGKDWIDHGVDLVIHEMRRKDCRWLRN